MPIISRVGRRNAATRALVITIYLLLILGAITMVYPFLLMLAISITSPLDYQEQRVIPRYLYDRNVLYVKFIEDKYGDINLFNEKYKQNYIRFQEIPMKKIDLTDKSIINKTKDWYEFTKKIPLRYTSVYYVKRSIKRSTTGNLQKRYMEFLQKKFKQDIHLLNREYAEENELFGTVFIPYERPLMRDWEPERDIKTSDWDTFKSTLPSSYIQICSGDYMYQKFLKKEYETIELLNRECGRSYQSFNEVCLPEVLPRNSKEAIDWERFVRDKWPYRFMKIAEGQEYYTEFLKERYKNIENFNQRNNTNYAHFNDVPLFLHLPEEKNASIDWQEFIKTTLPVEYICLESAEHLYSQFLEDKYKEIENINKEYGTQYKSFSGIDIPYQEIDWLEFNECRRKIYFDFLVRNYREVIDFIFFHGRALLNTSILVVVTVIFTLTINPLCAYALSRFKLSYAHKILLFLLATMAFPAEVVMIPNFFLLKEFHMLNTYWALILPGMASGFSIFLLKGFFDSLPEELYEAALIDGASELAMFWNITIPLSKPIFAVLALGAFTTAYGSFMWAFIVCQKEKMWTMMVYLYQFQILSEPYLVMAALVIASIPTLLVFILCQNIIMRGIILPTFK